MKVLIFGGATEGRILSAALLKAGIDVTLSVATGFGRDAATGGGLVILTGRLEEDAMIRLIKQGGYEYVIDATHPYAVIVTKNIRSACRGAGVEYIRLLRPEGKAAAGITYVPDAAAAVEILNKSDEKILLTTGSKELEPFTLIENYKNRIFIRILPMPDSLNRVLDYGFRGSNVICMQGPFDTDMNIATLKMTGAKFLVTKDSGDIGGFEAKISAALSIGCEAIVISRPVREEGLTTEEILSVFGINESPSDIPGRTAYFPLFVDMRGKKVLIVGGGKIAERRIKALVSFGADVAVISPTVTEHIETAASQSSVQLVKKKYEYGDAARLNPFFVIAATSDRLVNQTVMKEAVSLNLLISVSDSREECSCYFPAIAENDAYIAGLVSKNGDHAGVKHMAEKIRELLNAWV